MKKKLISMLLVAVMILPIIAFTGCSTTETEGYITPTNDEPEFQFNTERTLVRKDPGDEAGDTTFVLAKENSNYELYFNEAILEIALKEKKTGKVWYSNPAPSERKAGIMSEMSSQLTLFCLNKTDGSQKQLESYLDCILNQTEDNPLKQYYVVNHNGNLRVVYIMGQVKPDYIIPTCMDEETALKYIEALKANGHASVAKYISGGSIYTKLTPQTWAKYPSDRQDALTKIAPNIADFLKKGETVYIIGDKTRWNNGSVMKSLQDALVSDGGMTLEERDRINGTFGVVIEGAKNFYVPVDYELTESGLTVTVPNDEIHYDKNTYAISTMTLLQYFGSASNEENGYMFVPDGSGAIINFNNGKTNISDPVRLQLYGLDDGREIKTKPYVTENASLPVFGIKKDDSALFAIIGSGDTNAEITADIAGKSSNVTDRNRCYATFKLSEYMELEFKSSGKTSRIYQNKMNSSDLSVSYTVLTGDKADYNGMAEYYRNYLTEKGVLKKQNFDAVTFNIELIGAYDRDNAFLGVPYTEMRALTTFEECGELIKKLADAGIKNVSVNYKGWANNGLRNSVFNRVKVLKALGGKDGLKKLVADAESLGVNIYFETELAFVYDSVMFDGYSQLTDAARYVSRDIEFHYQFYNDWNVADEDENVASVVAPSIIYNINAEDNSKSYAVKLNTALDKLDIKCVSMGSLGYNLPGNYKIKNFTDRNDTAKTYTAVAEMFAQNKKVMAKGTNSYMLPYVSSVFEISNTSSMFNLADLSIPFYQMVIHGSIEYSGEPINLNGDTRNTFLQAVEAGSGMYYRWCYAPNGEVQDLLFDGMYSLGYESWFDDAVAMYKEYNELLASTAGQYLVKHENVAENVNRITYEDGTTVYINYNSYDYTAPDGTVVKAESFAKGGKNK